MFVGDLACSKRTKVLAARESCSKSELAARPRLQQERAAACLQQERAAARESSGSGSSAANCGMADCTGGDTMMSDGGAHDGGAHGVSESGCAGGCLAVGAGEVRLQLDATCGASAFTTLSRHLWRHIFRNSWKQGFWIWCAGVLHQYQQC